MCALVGPLAEAGFSMMRVDKAFIATNGIEAEEGITTSNLTEAATKRKMIQIAKQVILLADHSKAGKAAFAKFADIHEVINVLSMLMFLIPLWRNLEKLGLMCMSFVHSV